MMKTSWYKKAGNGPVGQSHPVSTRQRKHDRYVCLRWSFSTALNMAFVVYLLATCLYLFAPAWSAPNRCRNEVPVVNVKNGSYTGLHSAKYSQDFFLGIPYAKVRACTYQPKDHALNMTGP